MFSGMFRTIRRPLEIVVIRYILISFIVIPVVMWMVWLAAPRKVLPVFILDKTVLDTDVSEHRSLAWVLTQEKYCKQTQNLHDRRQDYYGFLPLAGNRGFTIRDLSGKSEQDIDSLAHHYQVAYVAESYGVYQKDLNPDHQGRNRLVYGGLSMPEVDFLKKMAENDHLVIGEFNFIGSPTSHLVRQRVENIFGIHWTGWVGRFMESLDTLENRDIPEWLPENYMAQYDGTWPFRGSGIIFVHRSGRLFILEEDKHLKRKVPVINTKKVHRQRYGLPKYMEYPFWFDIMQPNSPDHILAYYTLYTTDMGDSLLLSHGILPTFPAVIRTDAGGGFYYFAGDFSDNPISPHTARFRGIHWFQTFFYNPRDITDRRDFFWKFYRPLVTHILAEYFRTLKP
ncbi:MAG: hypothetical protein ACE5D8_04925 [Fidelibacterota bacterium]